MKSHLSTDPEGDKTICGHQIGHYDKEIEVLDTTNLIAHMQIVKSMCERYIDTAGLDEYYEIKL